MEKQRLSIDVIIAKFVPILGVILFTTGLGYLIYTSIWPSIPVTMRLGLGFFSSFLLIGSGFSFSQKFKEFGDLIIGSGILLCYGTLIYGSRATDIANNPAMIPEVATIITAFVITLAFTYIASLRKSLIILIIGLLGAYLTPFVIGQNSAWASNMSFNSYLVYFAMINAAIFLLGREIAIHKIVPCNMVGLFIGTSILYVLTFSQNTATMTGFFGSETFSVCLMAIITILSVVSLAYSSKFFAEKNKETILTLGYIAPIIWFLLQLSFLQSDINVAIKIVSYIVMAWAYFGSWHYLRSLQNTRYQHIGTYAGWVIALIFAVSNIFGQTLNIYSSVTIAYIGLLFIVWNMLAKTEKGERILTAALLTGIGGIMSMYLSYAPYGFPVDYTDIRVLIISLGFIPAISLFFLVKYQKNTPQSITPYINIQSIIASILLFIVFIGEVASINISLMLFILPGLSILILLSFYNGKNIPHSRLLIVSLFLITYGFFESFFWLLQNIAPHEADNYLLIGDGIQENIFAIGYGIQQESIFANSNFINSILALSGYILALFIARKNQKNEWDFFLVTAIYTILLLLVNLIIIVTANQLGIPKETWGPRAIGTTIWWAVLAIILLTIGIRNHQKHKIEKLLGLLLLMLTIGKIIFYDLSAMPMDKKIIVLMITGGLIMAFSYFLQIKWYLKSPEEAKTISPQTEEISSSNIPSESPSENKIPE